VKVYLLEVKEVMEDWPEAFFRDRQWLSVAEAQERIEEEDLRKIIATLPAIDSQLKAKKQAE
jgi:hypothetical protein